MSNLLDEIQRFAYCYLEISEIALVTGCPEDDIMISGTEANKAFKRGRLIRKAEFNESLIKLTNQLSSPAMAIEQKIAEDIYVKDRIIR